jgi:hypothetical protein
MDESTDPNVKEAEQTAGACWISVAKCKASVHPAFCRPLRLSAEPSRRFEIIVVGQVGEGMSP